MEMQALGSEVARSSISGRYEWVDAAKGLGIILVVVGHALGGLIDGHMVGEHSYLNRAFYVIYTFHMPLFFFLSGLFVVRRVEENIGKFLRSVVTDIAYPYFLWSMVQFYVIVAAGNLVNKPLGDGARLYPWDLVTAPVSQFWFLQSLVFLHLFSALVFRLGIVSACVAAALVAAAEFGGLVPAFLEGTVEFLPFYFLAAVLGVKIVSGALDGKILAKVTPVVVISALALYLWRKSDAVIGMGNTADIVSQAWGFAMIPVAAGGIYVALAVSVHLPSAVARGLSFLGRLSMPIYVLHVMVVAGARIFLRKFIGEVPVSITLLLISMLGLTLPVAAYYLMKSVKANRLLGIK